MLTSRSLRQSWSGKATRAKRASKKQNSSPSVELLETRTSPLPASSPRCRPCSMRRVPPFLQWRNEYVVTPTSERLRRHHVNHHRVVVQGERPGSHVRTRQAALNSGWNDSQMRSEFGPCGGARLGACPRSTRQASFGTWNYVALRYNSTTQVLDGMFGTVSKAA